MNTIIYILALSMILKSLNTDISTINLQPAEDVIISEIEPIDPEDSLSVTLDEMMYEIDLLCKVVYSESNNQTELGQRLVCDTVLNRVDSERFPNTIKDVILQPNQYTYNCPKIPDRTREIVLEELVNRTNYDVLYFRTNHYHEFGTPVIQEDDHYFSK